MKNNKDNNIKKKRKFTRPDQIQVHDFAKASRYFSTDMDEEDLYEDMNALENNKRYMFWIQSFSKKIISITFLIYLVSTIFSIIMVYISFQTGSISGIDTFISETNGTFREVVGGYIIKSAVENAVKIAGNYYIGIADAKLNAIREKLGIDKEDISNNTEEDEMVSDDDIELDTSSMDTSENNSDC